MTISGAPYDATDTSSVSVGIHGITGRPNRKPRSVSAHAPGTKSAYSTQRSRHHGWRCARSAVKTADSTHRWNVTPDIGRWLVTLLVWFVGGCGHLPDLQPVSTLPAVVNEDEPEIVFADDADPAMAALPIVENQLLIQPYPGADAVALTAAYDDAGGHVVERVEALDLTVLEVAADQLAFSASKLAESGLIEGVHKNYVYEVQQVPDDPLFSQQPHLARIGLPDAWNMTVGSEEVIVAVVDTGVQPDHPDLEERIIDGWNTYDNNRDFADVAGHGTMVAGVMAATSDNAVGVAGVTWDNPLLAVRVTNGRGQGTSRHIAAGILWALGRGARVINVSFAPLWSNTVVRSAVQQAWNRGALVVISSGNSGGRTAARGYSQALFVGAVDEEERIAFFSDRGRFVDLVAPGTAIRSASLGSRYRVTSGTSFAAPIVSGVAALAWSINPDLRPVSIADALTATALDRGVSGKDESYGFGLVDALGAVRAASQTVFVPDNTPPTIEIRTPVSGTTRSGWFMSTIAATDRWGVADVVMFIDGVPTATDSRSPYRFVTDTSRFSPGRHELSFVATDLSGNASKAVTISLHFEGSTTGEGNTKNGIVFHAPDAGTVVSGNVNISATVSSDRGLATIEWLIDGRSVSVTTVSGTSSHVSYRWSSDDDDPGRHTITLIVTDTTGGRNTGTLSLLTR